MNIFKRPTTRYGKTPEPETPYQRAAQVWDDRIGGARVQARNWRYIAFGCLILSAGFASALAWQSTRGTVVPWVVEVDNRGEARAVEPASADYRPTDPQIAFHLARFIEQVRGLPADPIVVRQNWLRAYDFTTDRGAAALNDYARTNDPFTRVGRQQISVEVSSVIRASSARHPTPSASPGASAASRAASSPPLRDGPPSSPSPSSRRAMPSACVGTHSAFSSMPSTGQRN